MTVPGDWFFNGRGDGASLQHRRDVGTVLWGDEEGVHLIGIGVAVFVNVGAILADDVGWVFQGRSSAGFPVPLCDGGLI